METNPCRCPARASRVALMRRLAASCGLNDGVGDSIGGAVSSFFGNGGPMLRLAVRAVSDEIGSISGVFVRLGSGNPVQSGLFRPNGISRLRCAVVAVSEGIG